jgi:serine/threonine protein kinase
MWRIRIPEWCGVREAKAQPENTVDTILQVGQVVAGKYRVDYLAGRGGMAAVWAGTNERTGKKVALKVILQSMATTDDAQRLFLSEAFAASRVNHPNVVTVFDVIDHVGMACIVMEFLDGETLASYIARKGALSISEATALLLPAMRGVAAAHAQDVIHRDLKPQNIFLCIGPDGRVVTSKVLDFGISVILERVIGGAAGPILGAQLGTPAYMSPEHLSGVARVDERVDVYGFGLLLYEALTGQTPFPGEPSAELFQRVLTELPPPVTKFRPDLPPGLVRIIDVAIAKDPDHRYSDLNLMVTALEEEMLPVPPIAHLITPITGVPASAFRDALSGQSVVQAILRKEPSGLFQETKVLYGFSEKQNEKQNRGSSRGEAGAANGAGAKAGTPEPSQSGETVLLNSKPGPEFLRIRSRSGLQAWLNFAFRPLLVSVLNRRREWASAGIVVAMAFTVWIVIREPSPQQAARPYPDNKITPSAPEPVQPSTLPSFVPTVTPAPTTLATSPGAPGGLAASEQAQATSEEHVTHVPLPSPRSGLDVQAPAGDSLQRRRGRNSAKVEVPARASRDRTAEGHGRPRSGNLSEDDF